MHSIKNYIMLAGLVAISANAVAEEEEEAPTTFVYSTYFYCDVTGEDRVDEIVKNTNAPVYDQMVKDGVMTGWGWFKHHTGGKWRRLQYHQASSLQGLLDAQDEMAKRFDALEDDSQDNEFGKICNAHEDYIWEVAAGNPGKNWGAAAFSVYYVCNESKEERADEIFKNDFGPILDKYVAAGKLNSWGWLSHWVGGKYRRLQTMSAGDHKSLLKVRSELLEEMYAEDSAAGEEFTQICGSHSDYMWDVMGETSEP